MRRRRLPSILLTAATVASLVLCVATVVLWVRSSRRPSWVALSRVKVEPAQVNEVFLSLGWSNGRINVRAYAWRWTGDFLQRGKNAAASNGPGWTLSGERGENWWDEPDRTTSWGPFRWSFIDRDYTGNSGRDRMLSAPCWLLSLFTASGPVGLLIRWIGRRRRLQPGRCPACGYDLRATPDRCPECGRAAFPSAAAAARSR
jgi:hypothetical protein